MTITSQDISVVIPSYNSRKTIDACLNALLCQDAQPKEIIVVDSSTDDTPQYIARQFPQINLMTVSWRLFPGPARNMGAQAAAGSVIAFVDSDCIPSPDWLGRIAERHAQGHQAVGGAIEVGNPRSNIAWAGHLGEFREFLPVGEAHHKLHIPTCNISYRKNLFEARGGFPDSYYPQEDLLFNYMLNRQGVKVFFDPAIRVRHFCREDLRGFLSHQHRIGRVTRCTLQRIDMPGSRLARKSWLAWLSAPFLTYLKIIRTFWIFAKTFPQVAWSRPSLFILILLGSIWWGRGFAAGALTGLSGIRGWTDPDEPIFTALLQLSEVAPDKNTAVG